MYIIFGGTTKHYHKNNGAESIIGFIENREDAILFASNYIYDGVTKEETWSQVYDLNLKCIIWNNYPSIKLDKLDKLEKLDKKDNEIKKQNYISLNEKINININN